MTEFNPPTMAYMDLDDQLQKEQDRADYASKGKFGQWLTRNQDSLQVAGGTIGGVLAGIFGSRLTPPVEPTASTTQPQQPKNNTKLFVGLGLAFVLVVVTIIVIKRRGKK